jgi:hypothetical protein
MDSYIPMEIQMKSLILATALAMPLAVMAAGDKSPSTAANPSGESGAETMFKSMDKNKDGSISRDEAKGTPHDKEFAALDKNRDGKLSRDEHAAAPAHVGEKRPATSSSSTPAPSGEIAQGKQPK